MTIPDPVEPGRRAWITHTAEDGTLFEGDPRPHEKLVKDAGFEYRRTTGWYVLRSRDQVLNPQRQRQLQDLADALNTIGFEVAVEIDNTPRSAQERYDSAEERAEDRRTGLSAAAQRREVAAAAAWKRSDELTDGRPPGQPILVGHHSEKSDRARLARSAAAMHRSMELAREADTLATRAARVSQRSRDSLGTILRRIEKLKGEVTTLNRYESHEDTVDGDKLWQDWHRHERIKKNDDLALWEQVRDLRVAAGEKVWAPSDFKKGDRVNIGGLWGTVEKVNPKSIGVRTDVMPKFVDRYPYDKVTARRRPGEEAA